MSVRKSNQKA